MNKVEQYFNKLRLLLNSIFSRGTITLIDDETGMQSAQAKFLADEVLDNMPRVQDYGFTSNPKPGAEALAIFLGGRRSNGAIIKVDDRRYRLKGLQSGEVAIYTDEGDKIVLKRGNKIEVTTKEYIVNAETKITMNAPLVEIKASSMVDITSPETKTTGKVTAQMDIESKAKVLAAQGAFAAGYNPYVAGAPVEVIGDMEATGEVKDAAGTMAQIRSTYNGHTHTENNQNGGSTGTPSSTM